MKTCLVVDDSEVIRKVARRILESMKMAVVEAANGQEALERCLVDMPDAILLDWNMPVMSGVDFLAALRLQGTGKKPYVFYCTTENDADEINRAFGFGADEYLLKPFDKEGIQQKMTEAGMV